MYNLKIKSNKGSQIQTFLLQHRKIFAFYAYSDVHLEKVVTILTLEKKKKVKLIGVNKTNIILIILLNIFIKIMHTLEENSQAKIIKKNIV